MGSQTEAEAEADKIFEAVLAANCQFVNFGAMSYWAQTPQAREIANDARQTFLKQCEKHDVQSIDQSA